MPDGAEFDGGDAETHSLPLWARRVRAVYRKAVAPVREPLRRSRKRLFKLYDMRVKKPARRASKVARKMLRPLDPAIDRAKTALGLEPLQGRVDWAKGAQIGGWVLDPNRSGRRVHVIARCEGQIVAETLADLSRRDLLMERVGDGRHGFVLQLPASFLDGRARAVTVEGLTPWGPKRIIGGEVTAGASSLQDDADAAGLAAAETRGADVAPAVSVAAPPPQPVALLIWGAGDMRRTLDSWSAQTWPRLAAGAAATEVPDGVQALGDPDALKAFARGAHTVILARAGDVLALDAARILARSRPIADVITFDDPDAPGGRRAEARALGVLLGETLGGAFAVRGHALTGALEPRRLADEMGVGELELALAADRSLRWAHAGAALAHRVGPRIGWRAMPPSASRIAPGFSWRAAEDGLAPRLSPDRRPGRITLAVWPAGGDAWAATVQALVRAAPDVEIEVLAPPADLTRNFGAATVEARAIDAPSGGEGEWLRTLGEAASGEVVIFCRAGARPPAGRRVLEEMAAWALSPWAGAVTVELSAPSGPLAGMALQDAADGWRALSGHEPARAGHARPILAATGLLAVSRAKLSMIGGVDDQRFPDTGAELDLCLRLRSAGLPAVLIGAPDGSTPADPFVAPQAFAAFDPLELAAAAAAYRPSA